MEIEISNSLDGNVWMPCGIQTKHGNPRAPQKWKDDPKLGRWVCNQCFDCEEKNRTDFLNVIGFEWTVSHK